VRDKNYSWEITGHRIASNVRSKIAIAPIKEVRILSLGWSSRAALYAWEFTNLSLQSHACNTQSLAASFSTEYGITYRFSQSLRTLSSLPQVIVSTIPATADVEISREYLNLPI
ncbi:8952_t:CDS:1, partial [Paraglomus occultum]